MNEINLRLKKQHAMALIVLIGMLSFLVATGIGRFAYTPILPEMLREKEISIAFSGGLAASNFLGYLVGGLLTIGLKKKQHWFIPLGFLLVIFSTFALGFLDDFALLFILRFIQGLGNVFLFLGAIHWGFDHLHNMQADLRFRGFFFGGTGLGIALTGATASLAFSQHASAKQCWLILALTSTVIALLVWALIKKTNRLCGEIPTHKHSTSHSHARGTFVSRWCFILGYGLAGFGYISMATFFPLIVDLSIPPGPQADFAHHWLWPILGLVAFLSAGATGFLNSKHNSKALIFAYLLQAIGIVLPTLSFSISVFAISSVLFGAPLFMIVMLASHEAKTRYGATNALVFLGTFYSLGQIIGPIIASRIQASTGAFTPMLWVSSAALFLSALLTIIEKRLWSAADKKQHST